MPGQAGAARDRADTDRLPKEHPVTATESTAAAPAYRIGMITVDCRDARSLAGFWSRATGAAIIEDHGEYIVLETVPRLAFQQVPDPTPGKNRVHLDGGGGDRLAAVARLRELGATERETRTMEGFAWTVMEDPEGNVFCVGDDVDHG